MSVHISEIGVRLAVGGNGGRPGAPAESAGPARTEAPQPPSAEMIEAIVARCTQRVIEHLRAIEAR